MKTIITYKEYEKLNLKRRTVNYSENSIELAAHTHTFLNRK
jgi:hypothetical protein